MARGHTVHICVRHTIFAQQLLGKAGLSYSQSPYWSGSPSSVNPASYAEILLRCGYSNVDELSNTIKEWRRCFSTHRPDLLIVDHAPTALLAARGLGIRTAQIGSGFFSPPRISPFPIFRNWEEIDAQRVGSNEELVLRHINDALERSGTSTLSDLLDLFLGINKDFLCTWKELDTYPERAAPDYHGPIFAADMGQRLKWIRRKGSRVFLYLKPDYPYIHELMKGLRESTLNGVAYFSGGIPKSLLHEWPSNVAVYAKPVRLSDALRQADAVVCHGGPATISAALLAPRWPPQTAPLMATQTAPGRTVRLWGVDVDTW
jgi:hypothetical protein